MVLWASESKQTQQASQRCSDVTCAVSLNEQKLTVPLKLLLQSADLTGPCFLRCGLYLLGPGGYL